MWPLSCAMTPISWLGRLGAHDQAGVDEDALAARHEGVERVVLDDHDLDRVGIEPGRPPDRRDHGADRVLDLGVADQIESLTLLRARGTKRRQREQRETEEGDDAFDHGRHGLHAGYECQAAPSIAQAGAGLAVFLLAACGGSETDREATPPMPPIRRACRRAGAACSAPLAAAASTSPPSSADESRAAEVGRDVLQAGGNATDAAVAMYFAMAVTLPSAASLGASGVCIVHDAKTRPAEAFVFAPVAAPGRVSAACPFTVPSRRARHHADACPPWPGCAGRQTVAPAERLARLGVPVSRALSRDLQAGAAALGADSEARRIFGKGSGTAVTEGDNLTQTDLAATLGVHPPARRRRSLPGRAGAR